jgi:hypothetical protein
MFMRIILVGIMLLLGCFCVVAQEATTAVEKRVALSERAVALDASGAPALEATLKTTALHGAEDSPVTNTRLVIRNVGGVSYTYVSGLVTFYDSSGVRCAEGLFKADALNVDEAVETDTPGIRIRCAPTTWRIVAGSLIPRVTASGTVATAGRPSLNLVIAVDGEEHPIQLEKPMVLKLGAIERTIVLREAP